MRRTLFLIPLCILSLLTTVTAVLAQETPPRPGPARSGEVPRVAESKLANGLRIAVGTRTSVPLVTIRLLVNAGADNETIDKAGLADLTASLLTKGTRTRSAPQIAEQIEFLGGSINSGAGWNRSSVSVTVTSDKVDQALAILADVVLNPTFKQSELDLLRSQTTDELTYNLRQPGFLANYVSSRYSFGEHPTGGTPASIAAITRADIAAFHKQHFRPANSVLIFTGDIAVQRAQAAAQRVFRTWRAPAGLAGGRGMGPGVGTSETVRRILVVDLPNSGQAAVKYNRRIADGRIRCDANGRCRTGDSYFPAMVLNSVLGGGYSARLNQEIRIKRGLSYGAGSSLGWRGGAVNFGTSTQTKPESAAEVAELVVAEIEKLVEQPIAAVEMDPRKLVLSGDFSRDLETTVGLAERIAELYSFGLRPDEMQGFIQSVRGVTGEQVRSFAADRLPGGDIVIVGDAKMFMDDLKARFRGVPVETIAASDLDIAKLQR